MWMRSLRTCRPSSSRSARSSIPESFAFMRTRWLFLLLAAALLRPSPASAQAAAPATPTNDDCLTCHGDPGAVRADGRPVVVKPEAFGASVHAAAGLACVDCHADLAKTTDF